MVVVVVGCVVFYDMELLMNVLWVDLFFLGKCLEWVWVEVEMWSWGMMFYLFCVLDVLFEMDL